MDYQPFVTERRLVEHVTVQCPGEVAEAVRASLGAAGFAVTYRTCSDRDFGGEVGVRFFAERQVPDRGEDA